MRIQPDGPSTAVIKDRSMLEQIKSAEDIAEVFDVDRRLGITCSSGVIEAHLRRQGDPGMSRRTQVDESPSKYCRNTQVCPP